MKIQATLTPKGAYIPVIIHPNELSLDFPIPFIIDTGAENTTISSSNIYLHDNEIDFSKLETRKAIGIDGISECFLLQNATIFFYSNSNNWIIGGKFDNIGVIPPKYHPITNRLVYIPSMLGLDVIGKEFTLYFGTKQVYLERQ